jgi:hypothetical protein
VIGGRKGDHVGADLGGHGLRCQPADPGGRHQQGDRRLKRGRRGRLQALRERLDVRAAHVVLREHELEHYAMMRGHPPCERHPPLRQLLAPPAAGLLGQRRRRLLAGDELLEHRPPRHPQHVTGDRGQLDIGCPQSTL